MPEHKTELLDYIRVFWKRKWLIIIPTLICALGTFLWSRLSDPVWEVDCLIQTGSLMVQSDAGILQEISASKPKDIAAQISQGSFNEPIATELNLSLKTFQPLTAEDIKDTRLVHVILKTEDIAEGKAILNSLFNHLKVDLDAKVEFERKAIDAQVKGKEIELENLDKTIPVLKSKVAIVRKRIDSISREMDEVKKRIDTLDKEQLEDLKKTGRAESESLAVLLYSNEVQQSLRYLDYLREMESDKKIQADDIRLDVENIIRRKNQIENDIALLVGKKARMELSQLIKNPTSSLRPVSPKPWLNLLIAVLMGLAVFTTLAFFLEYLGESQKQ